MNSSPSSTFLRVNLEIHTILSPTHYTFICGLRSSVSCRRSKCFSSLISLGSWSYNFTCVGFWMVFFWARFPISQACIYKYGEKSRARTFNYSSSPALTPKNTCPSWFVVAPKAETWTRVFKTIRLGGKQFNWWHPEGIISGSLDQGSDAISIFSDSSLQKVEQWREGTDGKLTKNHLVNSVKSDRYENLRL